jgi:Flp pilus assembly protein CpaB
VPDLPDLVEFPVAAHEVPAGQALTLDDLVWMALPPDYFPQTGAIAGADEILGRVPTDRLLPFELIRAERLAAEPLGVPMPADARPNLGSPFYSGAGWRWRREQEPMLRPTARFPTVMVIVASKEMPVGHFIEEHDLYAVQIPPELLPEGVFLSPEHVVGRNICERILQNELVRAARLYDPEGPCQEGGPGPELPRR